jgi:hypothetical protein
VSKEYLPAAQSVHPVFALGSVVYVPSGQFKHELFPDHADLPAAHSIHALTSVALSVAEYLPSTHAKQKTAAPPE